MKDFFEVSYSDKKSKARIGILKTRHGVIETPCFVPVATQATLKSLSSEEIVETGTQLAFVNTYHLHLRPGDSLIGKLGGIHTFMHYDKPLISDSGGFQVFSLGFGLEHGVGKMANIFPDEERTVNYMRSKQSMVKIDDNGVSFRSHIDGKLLRLTPEISIKIQENLSTDIALAFDECTSPLSSKQYVSKALSRTHRWAKICLSEHKKKNQALLGIVQGGHFKDLRTEACGFMQKLPFDGFAIGGDLGMSKSDMVDITRFTMNSLPRVSFKHILGIGEIDDIFHIIANGADSFDCVMPTRLGRMGHILTSEKLKVKSAKFRYDITKTIYREDKKPLEEECECWVCQNYSRAYVHHLFRTRELLAYRLATFHNVYFLNKLVSEIRQSIKTNTFNKLKSQWLE